MLCYVNRSYASVQQDRYFSCQTSVSARDTAVLGRSDKEVIFIDDIITTNNSLALTEIKG